MGEADRLLALKLLASGQPHLASSTVQACISCLCLVMSQGQAVQCLQAEHIAVQLVGANVTRCSSNQSLAQCCC